MHMVKGGDLNGIQDIKPFMNWTEWSMPRHTTGDFSVSVTEYFLS